MVWVQNRHSRGEIDRAGERLKTGEYKDLDEFVHTFDVMNTWRASHSFPLNTMQMTLRRRAGRVDPNAIVAQRLKRVPSIVAKLRREPGMRLSRMQDLGGCRAVLSDLGKVQEIEGLYESSRDRHELAGRRDYVLTPKESGYRGVHRIYRYQSDRNSTYNNHRVEIQIRTIIQHAWATSVEVAGIFTDSPLKSSIGPDQWLEFFKYASSAFSIVEDAPRLHANLSEHEVCRRLRAIEGELGALRALRRFSDTHRVLREERAGAKGYFLLTLNAATNELKVEEFRSSARATEAYAFAEKTYNGDANVDVVLVASESIEMLERAYPNYFADTQFFAEALRLFLATDFRRHA